MRVEVAFTLDGRYVAGVDGAHAQTNVNRALGIGWVPFSTHHLVRESFDTPEAALLALALASQRNELQFEGTTEIIQIPSLMPDLSKYSEVD